MDNRSDLKMILEKCEDMTDLTKAINSLISNSPEDARLLTRLLIEDNKIMSKLFKHYSDILNFISNTNDDEIRSMIYNSILSNDQHFSKVFNEGSQVCSLAGALTACKNGTSMGYQSIDAITADKCMKQLKERVCEPQQWKRLATNKYNIDMLYKAFPDLREIRKNSRILAQGGRDQLNPFHLFPKDVLKKIAGETRSEGTTEKSASTIVNENFKKPGEK